MYDTASELYSDLQQTYFAEYYDLSDAERKKKWSTNINLKSCFLRHKNMMTGLKMMNL